MIVATAGHIDHGKTTLVRALTGVDTDRLPEEKARGISIDLGFAHWDTPGGDPVGFVDVPGHERFIRNMLCGVCAIDHVLLVVAADDGVMPQTREHLHIALLLGVTQGTVALTKADRVPPERLEQVRLEVAQLLGGTSLMGAPAIAVAALRGDGLAPLRDRLSGAAAQASTVQRDQARPARYIVDRAFIIAGSGTVVTGTVIAGAISANDRLVVSPAGHEVRVRGLQRHGRPAAQARAGERCAVNLAGIEHSAIARGDWLVAPQAHRPTDRMDVMVHVLASEKSPLRHFTPVHAHIGAADIPARLAMRRGTSIAPGATALAQLRLDRPVCAVHGERLILRDQSATRTLGGATVVDPFAAIRRTATERAAVLAALVLPDAVQALAELLATSQRGVDLDWFAQVFNLHAEQAGALLPADAAVLGSTPRLAFSASWLARLGERVGGALERFHRDNPAAAGMDPLALKRELAPGIEASIFSAMLRRFAGEGRVTLQGPLARKPGYGAVENPRDTRLWQQVFPLLEAAALNIPSARELSVATGVALPVMRDFLHRKGIAGELAKVTPERFCLRATLGVLAQYALQTSRSVADGQFTAAQYRDQVGIGRGLAIEVLECLDRLGLTRRNGNNRRYVGGNDPAALACAQSGDTRRAP